MLRRAAKYLCWSILALLLVAVAAYVLARAGLTDLDQSARDELGGSYLQAEHGVLSYTRQGDIKAPAIILVHGFSTPKFVWDQVTPTLLQAGYQVITFDHFGRGFSDRPPGPYDAALYRSELSSIIAGLELTTPLTLIGYSMGGANVVDYAAAHPEMVRQLVLIAPAGYMRNISRASLLLAPVAGEWLTTVFGKRAALASIEAEVEAGRAPADMLVQFEQQAAYGGYTDALLSTLRHFPMADLADRYRAVAAAGIPVTAIWGTADKVVPYEGADLMARDVPQLQLITLEEANHNMTFGQATDVASAMLEAITSQ